MLVRPQLLRVPIPFTASKNLMRLMAGNYYDKNKNYRGHSSIYTIDIYIYICSAFFTLYERLNIFNVMLSEANHFHPNMKLVHISLPYFSRVFNSSKVQTKSLRIRTSIRLSGLLSSPLTKRT